MPRKKGSKNKVVKPVEIPITPVKEEIIVESTAKEEFAAYLENMKRSNPHEYSMREAELLTKLNQL